MSKTRYARVQNERVFYNKHRNDYPNCRDKGSWVGGNKRYKRNRPTEHTSMKGHG